MNGLAVVTFTYEDEITLWRGEGTILNRLMLWVQSPPVLRMRLMSTLPLRPAPGPSTECCCTLYHSTERTGLSLMCRVNEYKQANNTTPISICWQRAKKTSANGWSPLQELEVCPHSGLYLLVFNKKNHVKKKKKKNQICAHQLLCRFYSMYINDLRCLTILYSVQ